MVYRVSVNESGEMSNLRWDFDYSGQWIARSGLHLGDDVHSDWRINVCDDGSFSVEDSDSELTTRNQTFDSFESAKIWCQSEEDKYVSGVQDVGFQSLSDFLGEQIAKLNSLRRCNVYMNDLNDGLEEHVESSGDFVRYADLDAIVAEMKTRAEKEKS